MALLDFIKNRQAQQQTALSQSQPETAKEMYTREAAQDRAAAKPVDQLRPQDSAQLAKAQDLFQKSTQEVSNAPSAAASAPTDGATSPQPMAQMSMNQDKGAPALSPTSAQMGSRASEKVGPSAADDSPAKSQERPTTMPRRPPSWER